MIDAKTEIEYFYSEMTNDTELKLIFKEVFIGFWDFHNNSKCKGEYDTLFCNIHTHFEDGHNCIACNLNESNSRIERFLISFKLFDDINTTFTNFILLMYLQVECIFEYLNILGLPEQYIKKNFQTLFTIKRWANFLKHPKSFMLVHHPKFIYESIWEKQEKEIVINTEFVKKFYAGDKKNNELYKLLSNKENVLVVYPDPKKLINDFCDIQKKFCDLIAENQMIREILDDKATIKNYYEIEDE